MRNNEEIILLMENIRTQKNISISELARRVKMSKSAVSMYFNRTRKFPLDRADSFASALGVTSEYLLGIQDKKIGTNSEIISIYDKLKQPRKEKVLDFANKQLAEQEQENNITSIFTKREDDDEYIDDHVQGLVAAGRGVFQEDNLYMEVRLRASDVPDEYDTIAKVAGDSMEPLIHDNDLLFIKITSQIEPNDIGIFRVNNKNFVKKLKRDYDGRWYLQSLNDKYEEIYLSEDDDIRTIGEVVDIYREG